MDRIGRVTIMFATVLLSWRRVLPLPCPAPGPAAGGVTPGPPAGARRPGGEAEARAAQADRTALPPLVVPSLEEMLAGATREPTVLRLPIDFAAFRLPSQSTAPTARAAIPPPRNSDNRAHRPRRRRRRLRPSRHPRATPP